MSERWIRTGPNQFVKQLPSGELVIRDVENVRSTLEMQEKIRRESARRPRHTETSTGSMREIASVPPIVQREMDEKCGQDPEKRKMFLRDHPELLSVPKGQARLPKKKIFSFPGRMRRES